MVLVDDASAPDPTRFSEERWGRLQRPLEDHVQRLPKVRLARLGERRGLMLARMEGAWRAAAEVVVFLDSHVEATRGWLEPLLARIAEDRRHVVVPSIDGINFDTFRFEGALPLALSLSLFLCLWVGWGGAPPNGGGGYSDTQSERGRGLHIELACPKAAEKLLAIRLGHSARKSS